MKRETLIWTIVLAAGVLALAVRASLTPMARVYVRAEEYRFIRDEKQTWQRLEADRQPDLPVQWIHKTQDQRRRVPDAEIQAGWTEYRVVPPKERIDPASGQPDPAVMLSWSRSVGVWIAAALTLCALSFLWGDNVFFKIMQSIIVGVSAGYAVVAYVYTQIVPNLLGNLAPDLIRATLMPGHPAESWNPIMLAPLALSIMMLWRLSPVGGWISRWPLAFFIGLLAGVNLVNIFRSDFVEQVKNTILPLVVMGNGRQFDFAQSLRNIGVLLGVVSSLTYFFFSVEHKGPVGQVARVGICVLMITFGASFGLTVMTRITVFSARLQFLFVDWLWLIDPLKDRG